MAISLTHGQTGSPNERLHRTRRNRRPPDHYFIEPAQDMPMDGYVAALRELAARFVKIN